MADVETRRTPPSDRGGMGWVLALVGIIVVLLIAWVLFSRGGADDGDVDIDVEVPRAEVPSVQVPEEIDVDVNIDDAN